MQVFFRLLLSLNALSFMGVIFLIKTINTEDNNLSFETFPIQQNLLIYNIIGIISSFILACIPTLIYLKLSEFLSNTKIKKEEITCIEPADDNFLSSYAGYFFVALSISSYFTLISIIIIMLVFIYNSRQSYFNPTLFILKYHFFYLTLNNKQKVLIITKQKIKTPLDLNLKVVNDYTFIDLEGE